MWRAKYSHILNGLHSLQLFPKVLCNSALFMNSNVLGCSPSHGISLCTSMLSWDWISVWRYLHVTTIYGVYTLPWTGCLISGTLCLREMDPASLPFTCFCVLWHMLVHREGDRCPSPWIVPDCFCTRLGTTMPQGILLAIPKLMTQAEDQRDIQQKL